MKHFIVLFVYKVPLEKILTLTDAHREYLQKGYKKGILFLSGPQVPRTGGMAIARCNSLEEIEEFFSGDPYFINSAADYRYIEFNPKSCQPFLEDWIVKPSG